MSEPGRDPFSQLLYPMLSPQPGAGDELVQELARAPLEKSAESNRLRLELLDEFGDEIVSAARQMAEAFQRGGRLLALGNGGSATSAADMVTEMLVPSDGYRPIPALCLTNDIAVVTGIGNDVGFGDVFVRQIIALDVPMTWCSPSPRAGTPRTSSAGSVKPGVGASTRSRSVGTTEAGSPANGSPTTASSFDPAVSTGFRRSR